MSTVLSKPTTFEQIREEQERTYALLGVIRKELFAHSLIGRGRPIPRRLMEAFCDLRDRIAMLFSLEDNSRELAVSLAAPHLCSEAERLNAEHDDLFLKVNELTEAACEVYANQSSSLPPKWFEETYNQFEDRFMTHQVCETELVVRALYEDLGVGD